MREPTLQAVQLEIDRIAQERQQCWRAWSARPTLDPGERVARVRQLRALEAKLTKLWAVKRAWLVTTGSLLPEDWLSPTTLVLGRFGRFDRGDAA